MYTFRSSRKYRDLEMAAQDAVVLENHIKLFVETKVGENVSMEFATGRIYIKPDKRHGSTTLGAFWARVIQSYFPIPEFTYKRSYSKAHGSEVLMVSMGFCTNYFLYTMK